MAGIIGGILQRLRGGSGQVQLPLFERAFTPAHDPLRTELDACYAAMREAMASGRREAIAALLTSGFVSVDVRGKKSTGDQMIDSVLRLRIDRSRRTATTTLVDIEASANAARVLQHYAMTTTEDAVWIPKKSRPYQSIRGSTAIARGCWQRPRRWRWSRSPESEHTSTQRRSLRRTAEVTLPAAQDRNVKRSRGNGDFDYQRLR